MEHSQSAAFWYYVVFLGLEVWPVLIVLSYPRVMQFSCLRAAVFFHRDMMGLLRMNPQYRRVRRLDPKGGMIVIKKLEMRLTRKFAYN